MDENGNGAAPADPGVQGGDPAGQDGGAPSGLYDKYVSSAPPEAQDLLREALHNYSREAVEPKLREAADFRKKYEGLSQIEGLDQVPPEALQELLQFGQIASDPEQFTNWYAEVASDLAEQDPDGFEQLWTEMGEKLGYFEDPEGQEGEDDPRYTQMAQQLEAVQNQMQEFFGKQEQTEAQSAADQALDKELQDLTQRHNDGEAFDDEFEDDLYRMAAAFADDDQPLHKAYERLMRHAGQAQSELVQSKLDQPAPANGQGRPDTAPEQPHTLDEAKQAALARMKTATAS